MAQNSLGRAAQLHALRAGPRQAAFTNLEAFPADYRRRNRNVQHAASHVSTAYGVLTLEAKWLVPAGTLLADAARDPKNCLIAVMMELHEHPVAHAARVLRESGATPTQTKVGIQLALGKPKPIIANELASNSPRSRISREGSIRLSMFTVPSS